MASPSLDLAYEKLESASPKEAKDIFLDNSLYTQAAFCAFLEKNFSEAEKILRQSNYSPGYKWIKFLCEFFDPKQERISNPGFLTFRISLEATSWYMLKNGLESELERLLNEYKNIEGLFPEFRKYIGSAYISVGNLDKGIEILQNARKSYPQDAEIYFKLAQAYKKQNKKELAIKYFKKTLKLLPGHLASESLLQEITSP
jgi:tetratricopeptide (TPR) repeat protein